MQAVEEALASQSAQQPTGETQATVARVSVCICTMRRPDDLRKALRSLAECEPPPFEVLVSDDSPEDDRRTEQLSTEFEGVLYSRAPREGLAANRNAVAARATGDWLQFIDDDVTVPEDFYAIASDAVGPLVGERVVLTGHEQRYVPGTDEPPRKITPPVVGFWCHMRPAGKAGPNCVAIASALFPREVFGTCNFDPFLRYGYEESDFTLSVLKRGYRIVTVQDLFIRHYPSPVNRDGYAGVVVRSAVYAGLRRQLVHKRDPLAALGFATIAVPRLALSLTRRRGLRVLPSVIRDCLAGFKGFAEAQWRG